MFRPFPTTTAEPRPPFETRRVAAVALTAVVALAVTPGARAQQQADPWSTGTAVEQGAPAAPPANNTTVIERKGDASATSVRLVALLTIDGQEIDQGLIWRVFASSADAHGKSRLVMENRDASPKLKLAPGDYAINAAFGRANLTRKISVKPGMEAVEQFVLNAGGLRVAAEASGKPAPAGTVHYAIYPEDRDDVDDRTAVMTGAKPNLIIRLNAGIYRIVSTYGDANAKIETDVTVEAGKLTEAALQHTGGKVTLKLVPRTGGDAVPDTRWTIQDGAGEVVKQSVGALPSHMLAPGNYVAIAAAGGQRFKREFAVEDGTLTSVEVTMEQPVGTSPAAQAPPPSAVIDPEADPAPAGLAVP